jgi:hypothetical protein
MLRLCTYRSVPCSLLIFPNHKFRACVSSLARLLCTSSSLVLSTAMAQHALSPCVSWMASVHNRLAISVIYWRYQYAWYHHLVSAMEVDRTIGFQAHAGGFPLHGAPSSLHTLDHRITALQSSLSSIYWAFCEHGRERITIWESPP